MREAEIGNKQLVRAFGDALKILDVKQFPGAISTEPMQMVVPLSLIPYKTVFGETSFVVGGASAAGVAVLSTDPADDDPAPAYRNFNELRLVGGLSVSLVLAGAPTSSDRFGIAWRIFDWKKVGSQSIWQNNPDTTGFPMDNDSTVYNFAMHNSGCQGSSDRRAGASMMPLLGWIPAGLKLALEVTYWDGVTSAPKVFPPGTVLVRMNAVESPLGIIPPV